MLTDEKGLSLEGWLDHLTFAERYYNFLTYCPVWDVEKRIKQAAEGLVSLNHLVHENDYYTKHQKYFCPRGDGFLVHEDFALALKLENEKSA